MNATMKVRKGTLNAFCVYSAAPAAFGYLPTSSTYEAAVRIATTNPITNGSHSAPPTFPATFPVVA